MNASVIGLRHGCRRLRALEQAIDAQRKRVATQPDKHRMQAARARLATLLSELDQLLRAADMRPAQGRSSM